jgi:hypothetical protein
MYSSSGEPSEAYKDIASSRLFILRKSVADARGISPLLRPDAFSSFHATYTVLRRPKL